VREGLQPRDLVRRIRKIEIATRRAVESTLSGQYHSVFKGRGMDFQEARAFAPGDDVRAIDWNVSARMGQLFVKRYVEERELTVIVAADLSASADFGSGRRTKAEVAAEIAALLAFSAVANGDRVGLQLFTDQVEKFVPPRKGRTHALRIVSEILQHRPASVGTDIGGALGYLRRALRRRAVVFLLSDFLDPAGPVAPFPRGGAISPADGEPRWARPLRIAARRHDVVPVEVTDRLEQALPKVGVAWLEDPETGETFRVDLGDPRVRQRFEDEARGEQERRRRLFGRLELDAVTVRADDADYVKALLAFFRARARRLG